MSKKVKMSKALLQRYSIPVVHGLVLAHELCYRSTMWHCPDIQTFKLWPHLIEQIIDRFDYCQI